MDDPLLGETGTRAPLLVVITGAAGRVGARAAAALSGRAALRLVDRCWPAAMPAPEEGTERLTADLTGVAQWRAALNGAAAVVHLAGQASPQLKLDEAISDIVRLTAGLAEAAQGSTLRKIVFASSVHTMGLHDRAATYPIRAGDAPAPCCEYGAAKVMCEHLLRLLAERLNISVVCLRLGLTGYDPATQHLRTQWLGDDDCADLLRRALGSTAPFGTYFGVSRTAAAYWDISDAERDLGYRPAQLAPPVSSEVPPPHQKRCLMIRDAGGATK